VSDTGQSAPARPEKRASAFRTIGEVADDLDLPAHVLRFWESKFPQLKPLKRGGGRRYYRPEDIVLLRRIRQCLYQDGYTIRGVQKLLGEPGADDLPVPANNGSEMNTLFPLDVAPAAAPEELPDTSPAPQPGRRNRRRPAKPEGTAQDTRTALEDVRRELLEARALLADILRGPKAP
jgi:DNA-binding transcriptional MerR regulator